MLSDLQKSLFRTAETAFPHTNKGSAATRKRLFRMPERAFWRDRKGHTANVNDVNNTLSTSYTNRKIRAQSRTENLFFRTAESQRVGRQQ